VTTLQQIRHLVATPLGKVWRVILLRRRLIAVMLAALAVFAAVRAAQGPPTTPVPVAARSLSAGVSLSAGDLKWVDYPQSAVPSNVLASPLGAELRQKLATGEPVTSSRVIGPTFASDFPGTRAFPLRISDGQSVNLISSGDLITLIGVAADGSGSDVLASDVPVLMVPEGPQYLASETSASPGRIVVVAVTEEQAARLAEASFRDYVTFVL
jgi:pilus assembly protein CpaB